jgi:Zn-dependent protease with chaperone function
VTVAVYLPVLLPFLLVGLARPVLRHTSPAVAARGLAFAAAGVTAAYTACLLMVALTLLDDVPPLSALDDQPGMPKPVPGPVALVAALLLGWGAVRVARDQLRRRLAHRSLRATGRPHSGLVVADWTAPYAIAVPGRPGHVLVTTGMLRLLTADERRVVLAHERAHLTHRHSRLVTFAAAAAAVNPCVAPVRDTVAYLVERWADEDAATEVGDRHLVARSVAKAALATSASPAPALGVHGASAAQRVEALGRPAPRGRWERLLATHLVLGGAGLLTAIAAAEFVAVATAWLR